MIQAIAEPFFIILFSLTVFIASQYLNPFLPLTDKHRNKSLTLKVLLILSFV